MAKLCQKKTNSSMGASGGTGDTVQFRYTNIKMSSVGCSHSFHSSVVHHKVSVGHELKNGFTQNHQILHGHPDRPDTMGYDVTHDNINNFPSEVSEKKNHRKCRLRRLGVDFLGNGLTLDH